MLKSVIKSFGRTTDRSAAASKTISEAGARPLSVDETKCVSGGGGGLVSPGQPVSNPSRLPGPRNPAQWR